MFFQKAWTGFVKNPSDGSGWVAVGTGSKDVE